MNEKTGSPLSGPDLDMIRAIAQDAQVKVQQANIAQAGVDNALFRLALTYKVKWPVGVTPEGVLVHQKQASEASEAAAPPLPPLLPPKDNGLNRAERRRLAKAVKKGA